MEQKLIHITSGRGPAECMWVVTRIQKEILNEARNSGIQTEIVNRTEGDFPDTLVSCSMIFKGSNLIEFLKTWEGSILWIGQSPFRKYHKRKNWFVEVQTCEVYSDDYLNISEIEIQTSRSSGPGGQHVNKTESAVRAIHRESGLSVLVQESRSQHRNKQIAIERLNELYKKHRFGDLQTKLSGEWKDKIDVQRGDPSRIYEGIRFQRKKH